MTGLFEGVLCGVALFGLSAYAFSVFGLRINLTNSEPRGIYVYDERGTLVEFCPEEPYGTLSRDRGYRGFGSCPDHAKPLLKRIVAREGDVVEFSADGISVNGKILANTAPQSYDSKGRILLHWPFGKYTVGSDEVWVAGNEQRGFDSRYFGPVNTARISAYLRPLLVQKGKT